MDYNFTFYAMSDGMASVRGELIDITSSKVGRAAPLTPFSPNILAQRSPCAFPLPGAGIQPRRGSKLRPRVVPLLDPD